jgi:tetratricopeptide (TPR) repeat protein
MAEKPVAKPAGASPSKPAAKATDPATKSVAKAAEPPKPVQIGGESLLDRIRPHIKKVLIGCTVAAVVLLIIFGIRSFQESRLESSTEKLSRVLDVAQHPIRGKDDKPDPKNPSYVDAKERAQAVLDAIAKQGTDAAGHAFRGGQLLDAGKLDEAVTEYRAGSTGATVEAVLCREGLGLALEAKASAEKESAARQKGLEEALAAFAAMQPDEAGPRRAYALYHQGRLQLLLGKRDDAKSLFEKAKLANKEADREIADLIEKRLASLGAS